MAAKVLPRIPSEEGKAGQLLRVKLINFMSHAHFEVYFSRYVNLVHGENGSGKSAILQAIQLCLGARASQTGRGKSKKMQDFIKHGEHQATILLSIWNTGDQAYCYSKYGKVITVERKIGIAGSSYSLYGATGAKVSGSRNELDELMLQLNICGNNPIVVLTQDGAREFLKDGQLDKSLYRLYMHATQFHETMQDIQGAKANVNLQFEAQKIQGESVKKLGKELADLQGRIKILNDAQITVERLRHLRHCFPYVQVREWENMVSELETGMENEIKPKIEELKRQLEENATGTGTVTEKQSDAKKEIGAFVEKTRNMKKVVSDLNQEKSAAQLRKNQSARNLSKLQRDRQQYEKEMKEYEKEVEFTQGNFHQKMEDAKKAHAESVLATEEELQAAKKEMFLRKQEVTEFEAAKDDAQTECSAVAKQIKAIEAKRNEILNDVKKQKQHMKDPYTNFGGENMQKFCGFIAANRERFHKMPLGPVGFFLSLEDDRWSSAVQYALGPGQLRSFIVTDFNDKRLLDSAAKQFRTNLDIIIYDFSIDPYHVKNEESSLGPTVLQVLRFKEECENAHTVRNVLIDNCRIDVTGLALREEDAYTMLKSQRITEVFLPTGRKVFRKGNSVNSIHDGRSMRGTLAKDMTRVVQMLEQELAEIDSERAAAQIPWQSAQSRLNDAKANLIRASTSLQEIDQNQFELETKLGQLKEAGPRVEEHGHAQIRDMQARVLELGEMIDSMLKQETEVGEELQTSETELARIIEEYAQAIHAGTDFRSQLDSLSRENQELTEQKRSLNAEARKLQAERQEMENLLASNEQYMAKYRERIESGLSDAKKICSEEEFLESRQWMLQNLQEQYPKANEGDLGQHLDDPEWVKKRTQNLEMELEKIERQAHGRRDELEGKALALTTTHDKAKAVYDDVKNQHEMQKRMWKKRAHKFDLIRDATDAEVDNVFEMNMRRRGHVGNINIDHDNYRLSLKVRMQGQDKAFEDMRSLSGGEKSFTTVAFVLSLAVIIISPFYCLDEFDVFMDAVNRRFVIEALLHEAYTHRESSQFVFFTPLPMGALEDAKTTVGAKLEERGEAFPDDFINMLHLKPPRA